MEFLLRAVLITEVISALNCVCRSSVQETHMRRTGLEMVFCVFRSAVFFSPVFFLFHSFYFLSPLLRWLELCVPAELSCTFFSWHFWSVFIWTLSGCLFSPWPFFFASFCSRFCSVVEPHDATLEVDTEQLVKPYLLSTTAFCHWLYAHMCLSLFPQ